MGNGLRQKPTEQRKNKHKIFHVYTCQNRKEKNNHNFHFCKVTYFTVESYRICYIILNDNSAHNTLKKYDRDMFMKERI